MIPGGTYLKDLLRTKTPEHRSNTFGFQDPKNLKKIGDHTPIQTGFSRELHQLKEKKKMDLKDDPKSRCKILKRSNWTDTLLIEPEKQAMKDIMLDYQDFCARCRMDIGINT